MELEPLDGLEEVGPRPETPKCLRTSKSSGQVSGKEYGNEDGAGTLG